LVSIAMFFSRKISFDAAIWQKKQNSLKIGYTTLLRPTRAMLSTIDVKEKLDGEHF